MVPLLGGTDKEASYTRSGLALSTHVLVVEGGQHLGSVETSQVTDVVCFHGNGFNKESWTPLVRRLQSMCRGDATKFGGQPRQVVCVDFQGHGQSKRKGKDYLDGMRGVGNDVVEVLDHVLNGPNAPDRVVIVAHSMGGHGTLLALSTGPRALVDRVLTAVVFEPVVVDPSPQLPPGELKAQTSTFSEGARKRRANFRSVDEARSSYRGRGVFASFPDESLEAYLSGAFRPSESGGVELACSPDTEAGNFRNRGDLIWPHLPDVLTPIVVVAGGKSKHISTATLRRVAATLPRAKFAFVPEALHCLHVELPDMSANLVWQHIRDTVDVGHLLPRL